jgi:Ca2+-binding EF-hand superfamily protein
MFDRDRDGILHIRETQSLLRCLGLRPSVEEVLSILVRYSMGVAIILQAKYLVSKVTCDIAGFSISFNEFLKLISIQRKEDPDQETLLNVFQ